MIVDADIRISGLDVRAVRLFHCLSRNGGDCCAGRANSVKARARDSGDLRSALTEFAPALRCHDPGQAGFLNADSKPHAVLLLRSRDFLLWRDRVLDVRVERVRGLF